MGRLMAALWPLCRDIINRMRMKPGESVRGLLFQRLSFLLGERQYKRHSRQTRKARRVTTGPGPCQGDEIRGGGCHLNITIHVGLSVSFRTPKLGPGVDR